jgi:tyrosyl-tRNA synthetase
MRIPDQLILKYFELTTTLTGAQIDEVERLHLREGGNPKDAKLKLAAQIVEQYHGAGAGDAQLQEWIKVHSDGEAPENMPSHVVAEPTALFRVMVNSKLAGGTAEAKRLVQDNGVKLDGETARDANQLIGLNPGEAKVLQVGRRKFVRLVAP